MIPVKHVKISIGALAAVGIGCGLLLLQKHPFGPYTPVKYSQTASPQDIFQSFQSCATDIEAIRKSHIFKSYLIAIPALTGDIAAKYDKPFRVKEQPKFSEPEYWVFDDLMKGTLTVTQRQFVRANPRNPKIQYPLEPEHSPLIPYDRLTGDEKITFDGLLDCGKKAKAPTFRKPVRTSSLGDSHLPQNVL
jgi:hypothetical protein